MARKPSLDPVREPSILTTVEVDAAWRLFDQGRVSFAIDALLPALRAQGEAGDRTAQLCALLLAADLPDRWCDAAADGVLSAALADLVGVVKQQDRQIATLMALLDGA